MLFFVLPEKLDCLLLNAVENISQGESVLVVVCDHNEPHGRLAPCFSKFLEYCFLIAIWFYNYANPFANKAYIMHTDKVRNV